MRTIAVFFLRLAYLGLRLTWKITRPITVGVRVLMVRDGHVLLVHHSYQDAWFMPGGAVRRGETLEQAARREAFEETRATLHTLVFIGTFTSFDEGKTDHISLFLCDQYTRPDPSLTGASDHSDDYEIDQVQAFPFDLLPDKLAYGHGTRIAHFASAHSQPSAPVCGKW
jgi:8-oxo-dGTP pyrophosphatase MutT (NUDIX family)